MRLVERRAHLSNLVPHKSGRMDRVTLMRSLARPLCQRGPPTLPFILSRRTFGSGPYAERTWRFGRGMENFQAVLSFEPVGPFQMNQYLLVATIDIPSIAPAYVFPGVWKGRYEGSRDSRRLPSQPEPFTLLSCGERPAWHQPQKLSSFSPLSPRGARTRARQP